MIKKKKKIEKFSNYPKGPPFGYFRKFPTISPQYRIIYVVIRCYIYMKGEHRLVDIRYRGHHPAGLPGVQRQRGLEGPQQVHQEHDHKGMLHIKIRLMNYAFQI